MAKQTQVMVDMVFSFGELGFQEFETSKYLTGILKKEGFKIEHGIAGIPTAWMATWGSGKPVIALGSDIDCIPQASQKPGVAYHDPMIEGAPGHGEGHNSGVPLNITAAIAVKRLMERAKLPGTIKLWPGVAEELVAGKAYFVRDGVFQRRGCGAVYSRRQQSQHVVGTGSRHGPGVSRIYVQRRERTFGRRAVAGTQRARCRRVDGHRLELPARTSATAATLTLRDHKRRRSAERRAASGECLVLLPRARLRAHQRDAGDRRLDGPGRGDDDQHDCQLARARHRLAGTLQQAGRGSDVRKHQEGRSAAVERSRSNTRESTAKRVESTRAGSGDGIDAARWSSGRRGERAAVRTTSAMSRGMCRRCR